MTFLTISEAALAAKVSPGTIYREIKAGRLPVRKVGRCTRILPMEFEIWMLERPTKEIKEEQCGKSIG